MVKYPPETCPNCDGKLIDYGGLELECEMCGIVEKTECSSCKKSFIAFPALQRQYLVDGLWFKRNHVWYWQCPSCRKKSGYPGSEWEILRIELKKRIIGQLIHIGIPPKLVNVVKASKSNPELMIDEPE